MTQNRLEAIDRQLKELARRLERLEGRAAASAPPHPPVVTPFPASLLGRPPRPLPLRGCRALGWKSFSAGASSPGSAAWRSCSGSSSSSGWPSAAAGSTNRCTVLAFLGSSVLLVVGVWLYEKKSRVEAALAAVASALSGLFATLIVATQIYDLIPAGLGLACAGLVGMVAVAIAVRWSSTIVAAIGILGALLAPWRWWARARPGPRSRFWRSRWRLRSACFSGRDGTGFRSVRLPFFVDRNVADNYSERLFLTLAVLAGFWALYVAPAIGYELRARSGDALPVASWLLLLANVVLELLPATSRSRDSGWPWNTSLHGPTTHSLGVSLASAQSSTGHPNAAVAWILGVAGMHILLGASRSASPISREIGSLLIAGPGALGHRLRGCAKRSRPRRGLGRPGRRARLPGDQGERGTQQLRLQCRAPDGRRGRLSRARIWARTRLRSAAASATRWRQGTRQRRVVLGASAAAALACGLLWRRIQPDWSQLAELAGAAALVYLASVAIIDTLGVTASGESVQAGQVWLSAFWTVTGLGVILYGLRRGARAFRLVGTAPPGGDRQGLHLRPLRAPGALPGRLLHRARPAAPGGRLCLPADPDRRRRGG